MADIAALTSLIEPEAKALGLALVRVKMFGGQSDPTLQVMAERPDTRQLTIDDCADLSRRISLTRLQDFEDWKSHEARINLSEPTEDGRKQLTGVLLGVDGEQVSIDVNKYKQVTVPFAGIADAKLLMTDALIAATAPLSAEGAEEFEAEEQD